MVGLESEVTGTSPWTQWQERPNPPGSQDGEGQCLEVTNTPSSEGAKTRGGLLHFLLLHGSWGAVVEAPNCSAPLPHLVTRGWLTLLGLPCCRFLIQQPSLPP